MSNVLRLRKAEIDNDKFKFTHLRLSHNTLNQYVENILCYEIFGRKLDPETLKLRNA